MTKRTVATEDGSLFMKNVVNGTESAASAAACDWRAIGEREHFVQFYERDAFLLDAVSAFIGEHLATDGAGIVIATRAHLDELERLWATRGVDVADARRRAQYVPLDATEALAAFMRDGWPDEPLFRATVGSVVADAAERYPRLRAFGEIVALLWREGNHAAALRLEELWNELAQTHAFALFCAYRLKDFDRSTHARPFLHICNAHARVLPAESYAALADTDAGLRAISEMQQKAGSLATVMQEREATERTLSRREKELSDFFEHSTEGLHRAAPDGTILWANKAELGLLGYAPEEYIGHRAAEFYVDGDAAAEYVWRALCDGGVLRDYPAALRCKDGSIRHVIIHSNVMRENGKIIYARRFMRDVTEHRRLHEELQRRGEQLARIGRALRETVPSLAAALGVADAGGATPSASATIERELQRLMHLADELLAGAAT